MEQLFIYGTLLFPAVLKKVTGKTFNSVPAVLPGFIRCSIKNCEYPAVIKNSNSKVSGMLLQNVDKKSMKKIADFEGSEYKISQVTVLKGKQKILANAFVWQGELELLEQKEWNKKEFELNFLKYYC